MTIEAKPIGAEEAIEAAIHYLQHAAEKNKAGESAMCLKSLKSAQAWIIAALDAVPAPPPVPAEV